MINNSNDTIVAISTSFGESGIGIVRISGKNAIPTADKIFVSKDKKKVSDYKSHTIHYGWIGEEKGSNIIDEVLLTIMKAPKTYTKEDVVEINCHGGPIALRAVLDLILENGCRLAEPGEFTKRAFLSGRIDLAQAEAVLDIIKAKTTSALKMGMSQLTGGLSRQIAKLRQKLLDVLVILEAQIDFPEEGIDKESLKEIPKNLEIISSSLKNLLDSFYWGRIFRQGLTVVICGKPNVGKSSLLNAILKQERSIVTHIAGTTRDTVEETIDVKGIPLKIVDTAGILKPKNIIDKKAIDRTKKYINLADLIILMFDASKRINAEDDIFIKRLKNKKVLAVINKIDLRSKIQKDKIREFFCETVEVSAKKLKNIEGLEEAVARMVYQAKIRFPESITVSNLRQKQGLNKACGFIRSCLGSWNDNLPLEFISQDIKDALAELDAILGESFNEEVLDRIFSEFCIGK